MKAYSCRCGLKSARQRGTNFASLGKKRFIFHALFSLLWWLKTQFLLDSEWILLFSFTKLKDSVSLTVCNLDFVSVFIPDSVMFTFFRKSPTAVSPLLVLLAIAQFLWPLASISVPFHSRTYLSTFGKFSTKNTMHDSKNLQNTSLHIGNIRKLCFFL